MHKVGFSVYINNAKALVIPYALGAGLAALFAFAGRLLPKEPLNILPFLVFLSPLPMVVVLCNDKFKQAAKVQKFVYLTA